MNLLKKLLNSGRSMGFRIVKTGMAATICVVVAYWMMLDSPFFAVAATVVSMGKSIEISFRGGKNRVLGTAIGAAIGAAFASAMPGNAGLCGIGIILTLYLCHFFKLDGAPTLACIVFTIVMLYRGPDPWLYAGLRCVEVLIGVTIALLVNVLVMPPNYVAQIKKTYANLRNLVEESIDYASTGDTIDVPGVDAMIQSLSQSINHYVAEIRIFRGSDQEVFQISCKIAAFKQMLHELVSIEDLEPRPVPKDSPQYPVFEYHLNRLICLYEETVQDD